MSAWEQLGKSDEWYTPAYIFDAMHDVFDLDVAHPKDVITNVPCRKFITADSLNQEWNGFVWMNPPFGGRNGIVPWLDKFFDHANGVALTPDRTSAPWWQRAAMMSDCIMFISGKIRFIKPDGTVGKSPSTGTTLFASGMRGVDALYLARDSGLGTLMRKA